VIRCRIATIIGIAAALTLLTLGGKASAATVVAGGAQPYQRWVDEAKVPTPDVTLTVIAVAGPHGCPALEVDRSACTSPDQRMIWMGVDDRSTFLHEVGHNADYYLLSDADRAAFMAIYGLAGTWVASIDPASPNEMFASVWAECAVKPYLTRAQMRSLGRGPIFGGPPLGGRVRHNRACRLIAAL
jgi:hypothetical protein